MTVCNQKDWVVPDGNGWKSISPWKKVEFVPPRVKVPPGLVAVLEETWPFRRVMKNDISELGSWLPSTRACQKGVAPDAAMVSKANPMIPAREPSIRPSEISLTATREVLGLNTEVGGEPGGAPKIWLLIVKLPKVTVS